MAALSEPALRLTNAAQPKQYELSFHFESDEKVNGSVVIQLDGLTTELQLHAKDMEVAALASDFVAETTAYGICVKKKSGHAFNIVYLAFVSRIGDGQTLMEGIYKTHWTSEDRARHLMFTTQCEATGARRIFPCVDEPDAKAKFLVASVTTASHLNFGCSEPVVLLNTDVNIETPLMSTYLFAMCVGHWVRVDSGGKLDRIRCWGTPAARGANGATSGEYAKQVAQRSLTTFESLFGVPYPLAKLDMVAVPDFAAGAMENWGLITYREELFYENPEFNSVKDKKRICETVAHEVAHQWFGNLVTMRWWDELWLNESFATWASHIVCDNMHPEWKIWDAYDLNIMSHAMEEDIQATTHAVHMPIERAEDIDDAFDSISYYKGGSILRMLHLKIGLDAFSTGLKTYMAAHKYGNATSSDLWSAMDVVYPGCSTLMNDWIEGTGLPLITVSADALTVQRLTSGHDPTPYLLTLPFRREDVSLPVPRLCPARIAYSASGGMWDLMLSNEDADGMTRATLLQDSVALFMEGRLQHPITDAIEYAGKGLDEAANPVVYHAVWSVISSLYVKLRNALGHYNAWPVETWAMIDDLLKGRKLLDRELPSQGQELNGTLAVIVAGCPRDYGPGCESWLTQLIELGRDIEHCPPLLRRAALLAVARHEPLHFPLKLIASSNTAIRSEAIIGAGGLGDPELLARYMRVVLLGEGDVDIPEVSASQMLRAVFAMPVCSGPTLFEFVKTHWPDIEKRFPAANMVGHLVNRTIQSALWAVKPRKTLAEAIEVFESGENVSTLKTELHKAVADAESVLRFSESFDTTD